MKMSYRDKCILVALVFIITVLVGGLTIIKSSVEKLQTTTVTYKQKLQEEADVKAKLATKGDLEQQIEDTYKECKKLGEFFLPEMKTYQIDQYVSAYFKGDPEAEGEGNEPIEIKTMSIEEASAEDIEFYTYELFNVEYELGTAADLNEARLHAMKGNTEYAVATSDPEQLVVSVVSVGVYGDSFDKYLKVCDKIDEDPKSVVLRALAKEDSDEDAEDTFTIYVYQLSDIQKPKY
ncbi:MAG: hypothetical protein IJY29_06260 [Ruminococcus sp.]|nr:hypothetical protein [Ruminococcus sp.]